MKVQQIQGGQQIFHEEGSTICGLLSAAEISNASLYLSS